MQSKVLSARITSKNQLTLPSDLVAQLGVRAGDSLRFEIHEDGRITLEPPSFKERVQPWVGVLRERGRRPSKAEREQAIRDSRGPIDE